MSFGERGESNRLCKQPDMMLDSVKAARRDEAEKAAAAFPHGMRFFDCGDYPLEMSRELKSRLEDVISALQPASSRNVSKLNRAAALAELRQLCAA